MQRPHPPLLIGGSRKRVLTLAAREADIVSFAHVGWAPLNDAGLTPMQEAARRTGVVRDAAGERFAQLDLESSPYWCSVTDDADAALEHWAGLLRRAAPDAGPEVLRDHPNVLVGPVDQIVATAAGATRGDGRELRDRAEEADRRLRPRGRPTGRSVAAQPDAFLTVRRRAGAGRFGASGSPSKRSSQRSTKASISVWPR